ncbi:EamA family transporter [Novosphingobium terrae]|uniref:EamA family transporter n=1 Tax=Novosphingobium terrae TaxID=2726189 RepID=UPI00198142CC|nr:EamA family transporter [Novosphingobium terrae]
MNLSVFLIILLAAALHAAWNAIVKGGEDSSMMAVTVTGAAALIAAATLPFLPPPHRPSWPLIAASAILSVCYYVLVGRTYKIADMSRTYPLMRGAAPLLVALASTMLLGDRLTVWAWCGVIVICAGVLAMTSNRGLAPAAGTRLALLNACVIASYTLVDGVGVRRSGSAASYTLWIFLLTGAPLVAWTLARRSGEFGSYVGRNWRLAVIGGAGTIASYGLALWAMTATSVAVVAALRETAIIFGTLIAAFALKERIDRARLVAALTIAVGAIILRVS